MVKIRYASPLWDEVLMVENFRYTRELCKATEKYHVDRYDIEHPTRRYEYPFILRNLKSESNLKILDAGGGGSVLGLYLAEHHTVTNLDADQPTITQMDLIAKEFNLNYRALLGHIEKMDFPADSFDATICVSVLEHLSKEKMKKAIDDFLFVTRKKVLITMDISEDIPDLPNLDFVKSLMWPYKMDNGSIMSFPIEGIPGHISIVYLTFEKENDGSP